MIKLFLVLVLSLLLSGCQSMNDTLSQPSVLTDSQPVSAQPTASAKLTREQAVAIALQHAGYTADQVRFPETELDRDNGVLHYDVDFEKDGYDYEYEIDAITGKILKSTKQPED